MTLGYVERAPPIDTLVRTEGDEMLIRVEDQPPRARLDYFRQMTADAIVPFDARVHAYDDFRGEVLTGPVGICNVTRVTAPPLTAIRTPRLIRASDPEQFKIDVQLRGHTVYAQGGREAALDPGDLTLLDLSRPSQLGDLGDEHEVLAVRFPHAALLELLIVALAQRLGREPSVPADTRRRGLRASVQTSIERRLGAPALSPGTIAAENHISLRYLHKLFETEPMTVAEWIRRRRLERCRRDLRDPALSHLPVRAIAAHWGLVDAAHFSRLFRASYGIPPGEYRLTAA